MRPGIILKYIGLVLVLNSAFMLVAAAISYFNGVDSGFSPLLLSALLTLALGLFPLIFVGRKEQGLSAKEGYITVTGAWLISCIVGMFPYLLYGGPFTILNAWFESVSGFTTTGATILTIVEELPKGLLFWRSATHWIGGLGVVMFTLMILPSLGKARLALSTVELSPLAKDNYRYTTKRIIRILLSVYLGLTVTAFFALKIAGMSWFDAINHAFSTVATGGFSTRTLSMAAYNSIPIEITISVFCFLSGIHYGLIFATVIGSRNNIFRSEVVRYYLASIIICSVVMTLSLWGAGNYDSFGEAVRHGLFQAITVATTTGYATADTTVWPPLAMVALIFLSIQCACAGSTSGGLKCDRVLLSFKVIKTRIIQQQHPGGIMRVKLNGVVQDPGVVNFAMIYIIAYFMFVGAGTVLHSVAGLDLVTSISVSISSMSNVGPAFGELGSFANFGAIPGFSKIVSTVLMLFGRLEIFGLIQLFYIKSWV